MEFIDLKAQYRAYRKEFDREISIVIEDAKFIGGHYVDLLEEKLAAYVGRKHCITCGNGTDALQLAYMAYEVGPEDVVFCPDMTFIASVEPAVMFGATPIFVDIDPISYNIDPADLEKKVKEVVREGKARPRFVVAVDFLGNPADYDALKPICEKYGMVLIEDAAQGMGGTYKQKRLCSFGDIATTSFFPSKPLGCYGDGGAVFTDNDEIADLIRSIRVHGKGTSKYDNIRIGINSRLDNLQAAVLCVKLAHLEDEMARRQEVAARYDSAFSSLIQYPIIDPDCRGSYAQYVLLASNRAEKEKTLAAMNRADIPSLLYYPKTMHRMAAFNMRSCLDYPVADDYAARNYGLPMSAFLSSKDQELVIDTVIASLE